jgi:hypothetical protein
MLSREGHGALIVLERETGLEEIAETGVMVHSDLSHELLCTIFMPRSALHDGAVVVRGDQILAAAALLPLTEMTLSERFGTRHRAALGITEDTDAVAVVVSEESGQMSVVERARIVRVPTEAQLERALVALLEAPTAQAGLARGRRGTAARLRIARRRIRRTDARGATAAAVPAASPATTAATGGADAARGAAEPAAQLPAPSNGTQRAPVPSMPPASDAAGPTEHEDDAPAHRVPDVPRDDEGGSTAPAAVNR